MVAEFSGMVGILNFVVDSGCEATLDELITD
jgi:hypothetical protein